MCGIVGASLAVCFLPDWSLSAAPASADAIAPPSPAKGLAFGTMATVAGVAAADLLDLASGEQVRLVGVQVPTAATDDIEAWPMAQDVHVAVQRLVLERRVALYYDRRRRDRWNRVLAHVTRIDDGLWLQGQLLESGLARVFTTRNTAAAAPDLLSRERAARAARTGIWSHRFYRIRNPSETWDDLDSFQIVEGRVVDSAEVGGVTYLNFGTDWRRDFTFRLMPPASRRFQRDSLDPHTLIGRRVRGRGWVFLTNGPMIDLTHRAQLEVLDD